MPEVVPFLLMLSLSMAAADAYILWHWQRFARHRNWNKLTYLIPWTVALLMLAASLYNAYLRASFEEPEFTEKFFISLSNFWYLPKLPLFIFFIGRDAYKLIRKYIMKGSGVELAAQEDSKLQKRREFIKKTGWAAAGVPFIIVGNGMLRTIYDVRIHRHDIPVKNLPEVFDGFRIVQISDIHAGSFYDKEPFANARKIANELRPDMITLTGDFVNFAPSEMETIIDDLPKLKAKAGVFACLGNHDHYMLAKDHTELKSMIRDSGIDLLVNDARIIQKNGKQLQLAGVDNWSWSYQYADFDKALKDISAAKPTILMCHDPKNWEREVRDRRKVDLMLAGHTHGGQVGIELFGKYHSPVELAYKYVGGLYNGTDQYLYVNRGIGTVGATVRIAVNPEITLLTLRMKS